MPHRIAAEAALDQLGIEYSPCSYASLPVQTFRGAHTAILSSPGGRADIVVQDYPFGERDFENCRAYAAPQMREEAPYTLRGLLPYAVGYVALEPLGSDWPRRLKVIVQPSPQGMNDAQTDLGLEPGINTLKIVRLANTDYLQAGNQIPAYTRLHHNVARAGSRLGLHDMQPSGHGQAIYGTAGSVCRAMQQSAQELERQFGWRIRLPRERRTMHPEIGSFVQGIDDLQDVTKPIVDIMHDTSAKPEPDSPAIIRKIESKTLDRRLEWGGILENLGLLERHAPYARVCSVVQAVAAANAAHMAQLHARLDDLRQLPDLSEQQQAERSGGWSELSAHFTRQQTEPILSVYASGAA